MVHRDIKPSNVLIDQEGKVKLGKEEKMVRFEVGIHFDFVIADFGVSVELKHDKEKLRSLAGSPYWCAPE